MARARCTCAPCRHLADDLRGTMARPSAFAQPEWKEKALGKAVMFGFQDSRPIKEQRMGLPIFPFREQILEGVKENQIIILSAETGSGKTTQVTQYLAEAGWTSKVRHTFVLVGSATGF